MITITVDKVSLEKIQKKLGEFPEKAPKVLANALNQTAKQARTKLARQAQASYTVKTGKFNKAMTIKNATSGNLVAEIRSTGAPLNITNFKYSAPKSGAKAQIVVGSGLKPLEMSGIKAWKGMNGLIWQRRSPDRLPIKPLKSNSVPKMIGSERRVYGIVKPEIGSDLQTNVNKQIQKVLGGFI